MQKDNCYVFGIDLKGNQFIFLNVAGKKTQYFDEYKPFNNKPAYRIQLNKSDFYDKNEIISKLKTILKLQKSIA